MSTNYNKEISDLQRKLDRDNTGFIGFWRPFLTSIALLLTLSFLAPTLQVHENIPESEPTRQSAGSSFSELPWHMQLESEVHSRTEFLSHLPLGHDLADFYLNVSAEIVPVFISQENYNSRQEEASFTDILTWHKLVPRVIASGILRIVFVVLMAWPIWLLMAILGMTQLQKLLSHRQTPHILSVCHKNLGPFYSGIYGPLRPNHSFSATDYSAPGTACPRMAPTTKVHGHPLYQQLKSSLCYSPVIEDLLSVILAHENFPTEVPPEKSSDDDMARPKSAFEETKSHPEDSIIGTVEYRLEDSTKDGINALLEVYRAVKTIDPKRSSCREFYEKRYDVSADLSPLGIRLLHTLSPWSAESLLNIRIVDLITIYLACEAGKALTFKPVDGGFTQISRYPHLQARAVLHSLASYHDFYNGDERWFIRRVILASRRHGDYGKAMLPLSMTAEGKVARDLMEVLLVPRELQTAISAIVELESYFDRLHYTFKHQLQKYFGVVSEGAGAHSAPLQQHHSSSEYPGCPYALGLLFPVSRLVQIAFAHWPREAIDYLSHKCDQVKELNYQPPMTARLPGLKSQLEQAKENDVPENSSSQFIAARLPQGSKILRRWQLLRQCLVRYNWLASRAGDTIVSSDFLLQSIVYPSTYGDDIESQLWQRDSFQVLPEVAVLRSRRLDELLGPFWKELYYPNTPPRELVKVFNNFDRFTKRLNSLDLLNKLDELGERENPRSDPVQYTVTNNAS